MRTIILFFYYSRTYIFIQIFHNIVSFSISISSISTSLPHYLSFPVYFSDTATNGWNLSIAARLFYEHIVSQVDILLYKLTSFHFFWDYMYSYSFLWFLSSRSSSMYTFHLLINISVSVIRLILFSFNTPFANCVIMINT